MNGVLLATLLSIIGGLLGLLQVLIGVVMKMHMTSDDEHRVRVENDIKLLRERSHDLGDKLSGLLAQQYLRRKDDSNG